MLFGCGNDRKIEDVQQAYVNMVSAFTISGESDFFSDSENPNSIVIAYPTTVKQAIENANPSNDVQKRYRSLYYQQEILDNIYKYYNDYQEPFYRIAASKDIDKDEVKALYNSIKDLHEVLDTFEENYETFNDAVENGISDVMEYNLTSYSFYLNKVIDASFDFIFKFHNMYIRYCVDDYSSHNADNLKLYVDKAYLDISYVVYLENIKSFNYSVGTHGVCDLAEVVGSNNDFNILTLLDTRKSISTFIQENIGGTTEQAIQATEKVNLFSYVRDVFEQRLNTYVNTYNSLDMYKINQYKFNLSGGVDYESYITSLSASDRATIILLDNFVEDNFMNYVEKLNAIVE